MEEKLRNIASWAASTISFSNSEDIAQLESNLVKIKSWRPIVTLILVLCVISVVLIPLAIFIFIFYLTIYHATQASLAGLKFLRQYASSRNLQFGDNLTSDMVTGRLLQKMDSTHKSLFMFSNHKNFLIKLFYFSCTAENNKKITYNFTISEITIKNGVFPYILLQKNGSIKHQNLNYFGVDKDIEVTIGSHDTTHTLYTTSKYEIEALQICTPEFIELIKSSYLPLSVEFAENHVYIYTQSHLETEKDLDELYRVTHAVIDNFGDFLVRMKDDYEALHEVYTKK